MKAWTKAALSLAACLVAAFLAPASGAGAADSYLTVPGEAVRAFDAIVEEAGHLPRLLSLELTDRRLAMKVQGKRSTEIDEWQIGLATRLFFEFEKTVGPRPSTSPGLVDDIESGFFARSDIALDKVPQVVASAIAYARLDDEAQVQSIEIARRVDILPVPAYGAIGWSIYVTSGRESAMIRADAAGNIEGGDLANTNRARNMDLLSHAEWPQREARDALFAVFGDERRLRDFTVRSRALSITADHPSVAGRKEDYSWTISGVTRSPLLSPLVHGASADALFSLRDVDFTALEEIRNVARAQWGNDRARLEYMTLRRATDLPGAPELRWTVYFDDGSAAGDGSGGRGSVELTGAGVVRKVNLPADRARGPDWLAPATISATLHRIGDEFPPDVRYAEISFDTGNMRILAEDRDRPGTMAQFVADPAQLSRSHRLMPWDEQVRLERLFSLGATDVFTRDGRLAEFRQRAYRRLQVDEKSMPKARYTFAIGQMMGPDGTYGVPSPDGRLTLEVRVESADGRRAGRVTYSSAGEEIDVAMP